MSKNNHRVKTVQLTTATDYDTQRMVFYEPKTETVPNSDPPMSYKRVRIGTVHPDGTEGDLILLTERLFSFGVSENKSPETGKVSGYVLPLCLWSRGGATDAEKKWTDVFNEIVEACKDHLLNNREELEKYELEREDLKKLNPLYWKKEKGKIVPGVGPTLYAKLIFSKKQNKAMSIFTDPEGNTLDAMSLQGKYGYAISAVKIESIFVGAAKIALQVKLYQTVYEFLDTGIKQLIPIQKKNTKVMLTDSTSLAEIHSDDEHETGSLKGDGDEEEESYEVESKKPKKEKKEKKTNRKTKKVA